MPRGQEIIDNFNIDDIREALKLHDMSALYFEAHVTISTVFGERRAEAAAYATQHNFRLAELLMVKDRPETAERSDKDTFMTGHDVSFAALDQRMQNLLEDLSGAGFDVWRYKIEDTVIDSRVRGGDIYNKVRR